MNAESVTAIAVLVGCASFACGVVVGGIGVALLRWLFSSRQPAEVEEVRRVDVASAMAEQRIADIHRQAHEMLASTVLRGTASDAEFDTLMDQHR